jgi:hypothetical protein
MLFALLAAGLVAQKTPSTVEGRVYLLEARQLLDSQQLWNLRSQLPPEALRVLGDLQLHLQHDQEQDDKVRELTATVDTLQQRLAALELMLPPKAPVEGRIPVAPMQVAPIEVGPRRRTAHKKQPTSSSNKLIPRKNARVAEVP